MTAAAPACPYENMQHFQEHVAILTTYTPEEHAAHVAFVREMIERERARREMWKKVRESAVGWLTVAILSGVGTLGFYILRHLSPRLAEIFSK